MPIIPVNPRGSKAKRLHKFLPLILKKRIRIRQNLAVEQAIEEIVAFPNAYYDDNVDALTNFLSEAPDLNSITPVRSSNRNSYPAAVSLGSRPRALRFPIDGVGFARGRSLLGPAPLPDFSDGQEGRQPTNGQQSPYAAETSSEPVFAFDGTKIVRLK
jgi:hypothetical protein